MALYHFGPLISEPMIYAKAILVYLQWVGVSERIFCLVKEA